MDEKLFDNYVKDKLGNFVSPVPTGLWEKISNEKKKRPKAFWWNNKYTIMLGLLLSTSAIGGLMVWQKKDVKNNTAINISDKITSNKQNNFIDSKTTTSISEKGTFNKNTTTGFVKQETANVLANQKLQHSNSKGLFIDSKKIILLNQQNVQKNKGLSSTRITGSTKNKNVVSNLNNASEPNEYTDLKRTQTNIALTDRTSQNSQAFTKADLFRINYKIPLPSDKAIPNLNFNFPKPKDCPSVNGNSRNDWYLESYAAPEYTMKKVSAVNANDSYMAKKDSAEKMNGGFTIGARISKNLTENLLIKAGIQFSQLNEKLTLRRENERRVTTVVTIHSVTDALGNTTTVSDTSTLIQIGYAISTSYNYYRNIELPIALSYEFGNKNFRTAINGGAIINLASWYKGKTMDTTFQIVNINPKENDVMYKHSIGLSLYGSISFIKILNESADIFAEPYFRYSLSSLQNNAYGFSQRFSALGLSLGLRLKLNKAKQHF
jgi:opacity protein-like surface antigen